MTWHDVHGEYPALDYHDLFNDEDQYLLKRRDVPESAGEAFVYDGDVADEGNYVEEVTDND